LPNAVSNDSLPFTRTFRRTIAQTMLRSFRRKPSHVAASAVIAQSAVPTRPVSTFRFWSRMVTVTYGVSSPVNVKWYTASSPFDRPAWKTMGIPQTNPATLVGRTPPTRLAVLCGNLRATYSSASDSGTT